METPCGGRDDWPHRCQTTLPGGQTAMVTAVHPTNSCRRCDKTAARLQRPDTPNFPREQAEEGVCWSQEPAAESSHDPNAGVPTHRTLFASILFLGRASPVISFFVSMSISALKEFESSSVDAQATTIDREIPVWVGSTGHRDASTSKRAQKMLCRHTGTDVRGAGHRDTSA